MSHPIALLDRRVGVRSGWGVQKGHAMAHHSEMEGTAACWTVVLLGGFGVRRNDQWIRLPPSTTRLVAFLALQARPVARTFVAGSLWIDESQDRAFANLRSALWRLRRHASSLVVADSQIVGLAPSVSIDVARVAEALEKLSEAGIGREVLAVDQFTRELLPGWSDDWALIERERHRQRSLHALEATAQDLAESGHFGVAIDTALKAIEIDPLRESSHRVLIRTHLAEGNYSEAVRHYEDYRELIEAELGITPSPLLLDSITAVGECASSRQASSIRGGNAPVTSR